MALTVTQAHAVNEIATFLLGPARLSGRGEVTVDEAVEALALLADHAHRTLMAGRNGEDVRRDWRANPPAVQANRRGRARNRV